MKSDRSDEMLAPQTLKTGRFEMIKPPCYFVFYSQLSVHLLTIIRAHKSDLSKIGRISSDYVVDIAYDHTRGQKIT